jgi:membrane protein implicated in regulation of membrane protease activity
VLLRYTAFQLPGQALAGLAAAGAVRWFDVPSWLAIAAVGAWVLKDAVMFPFVRSAFEPHGRGGAHDLIGAEARTEEALAPTGYVRVGRELWHARLVEHDAVVAAGERVVVLGVDGLTLAVRRAGVKQRGPDR